MDESEIFNIFETAINSGNPFSREGIESTELFQKGLLRITEDAPGVFGVINTVSGKKYTAAEESLQAVIQGASRYGIAEFDEIKGAAREDIIAGRTLDQSEYGRLSDLKRIIDENVLGASSGTFGEDIRRAAGLTDDILGKQLIIERIGFEKAKDLGEPDILQKTIADIAEGMDLPRTAIPGILNIQKDASVLLRFKVGDQYLTEDQIQKILVRTGSQILDPVKVQKTLGASDEQDILARIGTDMGKASKRVKASTSARNFVEDQEGVNRLINHINETIKPKNKLQTLDDAFLIYDTSLESTLKAFGIQDQFANELVSALPAESPERAAMYRRRQGIRIATESYTQDVGQNFFRQELRRVGIADSANTEVDRVMSFIQNALTGDDGFISKSIKSGNVNEINIGSIVEHLESVSESQGITSGQMRGIRATFMDSLKKTQDGSMFINEIVSKNHAEQLQDNIIAARTNLDLLLSEASLSPEQSVLKKNLQQNIATFEQSFNQIASGDPVLQQSDRSLR